ncbi:hypothetical protein [Mesorhizobium sp. IMUNJ 23232]|uniref:hypothetical protein n=1 Tax=Mesorhizobium sp. IMUNJ 23232 TaxID=3376064 RepID=UPI0037B16F88
MRSFVTRSTLAAILVSTSLAGAYAASAVGLDPRAPRMNTLQSEAWAGHDNQPADIDSMATASIAMPAQAVQIAPRAARVAVRHEEFRPRIAHIDRELVAANHRIGVDRERGYLTVVEYHALRARSHNIRMEAQQVAERHDGALPTASYDVLQHRVAMLDRTIRHDATT